MPKLSEEALAKRFNCPHCGESVRTRQGLSGHIQFKHSKGPNLISMGVSDWVGKIKRYRDLQKAVGASDSDIQSDTRILRDWFKVKHFLENWGQKVNNEDFKNYAIASLSYHYEIEGLKKT